MPATWRSWLSRLWRTTRPLVMSDRRCSRLIAYWRRSVSLRRSLPRAAIRSRRGVNTDVSAYCHGDMRAEHVIVGDDVAVFDCIEFNSALRLIDVGADLAFLVMDLVRLGENELGARLLSSYRDAGGDPGDDALLYFYASYRAWVRAKVTCLRSRELQDDDPRREREQHEARSVFELGHRLAWRARLPLVVAVGGVAASGKTALASRLSAVSGLKHLNSDVVRKRLAGLAPTQRASPEHYTNEFTLRTYEELGRLAASEVKLRAGAIVDATFHRADRRRAFLTGLGRIFSARAVRRVSGSVGGPHREGPGEDGQCRERFGRRRPHRRGAAVRIPAA